MKHRQKTAWFLSGVLATVLASLMIFPALALYTKNVQIYPGVKIYVDDKAFQPEDYNGNPLETFIYNDTTYLPVRAVSDALDVPIQWDNDTQSVYIGKHTGDKPAVWLDSMDYFTKSRELSYDSKEYGKDNLGNEHEHVLAPVYGSASITYKLNGKYSHLTGLFYQLYKKRSSSSVRTTLEIYTDGELAWEGSVESGVEPVEISLNVQGIKEIQFSFSNNKKSYDAYVSVGELGLWA